MEKIKNNQILAQNIVTKLWQTCYRNKIFSKTTFCFWEKIKEKLKADLNKSTGNTKKEQKIKILNISKNYNFWKNHFLGIVFFFIKSVDKKIGYMYNE